MNELNEQELIKFFKIGEKDTGSYLRQLISSRFRILKRINHLNSNHKDVSAKRAMLKEIARKRTILNYLKRKYKGNEKLIKDIFPLISGCQINI